jgi:citrate/tricarballylate utilization protein
VQRAADLIAEGARIMTICNACRYCEGYCPVFPAMERRFTFSEADLNYLANLCHHCGECYYACQYAPPHEFGVNVPQVLSQLRARSYRKYAWPQFLRVGTIWAFTAGTSAILLLAGTRFASNGDFYAVISHDTMVAAFVVVAAAIFAVHAAGFLRFWRESGEPVHRLLRPAVLFAAARDAFSLKHMDSNGAGCTYPNEQRSRARRRLHHFTFYGFMLCLASTAAAAVYHSFFGWAAPYRYWSIPVVLGTLGGIGLLIGPAGLYRLKRHRDAAVVDFKQDPADVSFLALLFLTSATGLLLLALRETSAMGVLLRLHLGVVLGLFLTLPYGKFVHGIYRWAALARAALEASRSQH